MLIELEHVAVARGGRMVLQDIHNSIMPGDFISIVGSNGAGKSTLFDALTGHAHVAHGCIRLKGKDVATLNLQERATRISRLFQDPMRNCIGKLTVLENFCIMPLRGRCARLRRVMTTERRREALALLEECAPELMNQADKPMAQLSGGQRQLLSFVMAIARRPEIILLDEPTAALDPAAATRLLRFANAQIKQHRLTALLITHDPAMAIHLGNRLWVLHDGRIRSAYRTPHKWTVEPQELLGSINYHDIAGNSGREMVTHHVPSRRSVAESLPCMS